MEIVAQDTIMTKDIYNFYFLWNVFLNNASLANTEFGSNICGRYAQQFKQKYIRVFKQILVKQLNKYYERKRIVPGFDITKVDVNSAASVLALQMTLTRRSDMKRPNNVWNSIADSLSNLENAVSRSSIFTFIDRLNNSVHNTQTTILDKLPNVRDLVSALDNASRAKNIKYFVPHIDQDLRSLWEQGQENPDDLRETSDDFDSMQSMKNIHLGKLDTFTKSYIETALWSSMDNLEDNGGSSLDEKYTIEDVESSTLHKMEQDCRDFQQKYGELYGNGGWSDEEAGHDLWLTRNGHGSGFWDRGYKDPEKEEIGKQLTTAAKSYGTFDLYLGDGRYDGMICGG